MPPTARKRPGDLTGRQAEILAVEKKEELAKRAEEISLTQQIERAKLEEVVDLTGNSDPAEIDDVSDPFEDEAPVEVVSFESVREVVAPTVTHSPDVHVERPKRTFRVNSDIENMTYGHGRTYTFREGQKYTAEKDLYDHLESLGYVYH